MNGTKPRICFVAHNAYGALAGGNSGHIGGVERQTSLMAKWLAGRGYHVSMITWDEGQADVIEIDGVRVFKLCRQDVGIPGLRFFWPRWTSLNAAMKRADADVYYQNGAEYTTGQVAMWCRQHGRKFVFSGASDLDCQGRLLHLCSLRERILYRYGLTHADQIVVQTPRQQRMLHEEFGRDSIVLSMPCPGPSDETYAHSHSDRIASRRILWVGRVCEVKRPDRLLDVANLCPDLCFDVVGPLDTGEYARNVCERARTMRNVTMHGPASRERVAEFYRHAKLLCCTSYSEGFPNTFLEAWSHGLPVVTTFDPGGLVDTHRLGIVTTDTASIVEGIHRLCACSGEWADISRIARRFYLEHYTPETAMARFEEMFVKISQKHAI